jgi:hypothetical protein
MKIYSLALKTLRLTVLCLLWLGITLVSLEVALRLARPHFASLRILLYLPAARTHFDSLDSLEDLMKCSPQEYEPHGVRNGFVLNSRSFRTQEYTEEKKPGVYRIMAIGDSFTRYSGGVPEPEMWVEQMERELVRAWSREVEAYALAASGVGPAFGLRLWEIEHQLVQPNLVILAFYVGNDFTDGRRHRLDSWPSTAPVRYSYAFRLFRNLRRWVAARRDADRILRDSIRDHSTTRLGMPTAPTVVGPTPRTRQWYLRIVMTHLLICRPSSRVEFLRLSEDVGRVLERFSQEVSAAGQDFLVVIIPDECQIDSTLVEDAARAMGLDATALDVDLPRRRLMELLDEMGIAYLDLLPPFREHARRQPLYWPNNSHFNIEGQRLMGDLVAEYISGKSGRGGSRTDTH